MAIEKKTDENKIKIEHLESKLLSWMTQDENDEGFSDLKCGICGNKSNLYTQKITMDVLCKKCMLYEEIL